jgi:hypothetical protein
MMQAQLRPGRDLADQPWLWMFGRLAPGVARDAARRELVALTEGWVRETQEPAAYQRYIDVRITDPIAEWTRIGAAHSSASPCCCSAPPASCS